MVAGTALQPRLTSLDQFRGYTIVGMLLVNFVGSFKGVSPRILQHSHDYCSYADTIMPQFLFAAGFAMRLSLGRRLESGGMILWARVVRRILGLALVAIAWYSICDLRQILEMFRTQSLVDLLFVLFKREYFQTLMHIAATSLWILPVIRLSSRVRLGYAVGSGILHILVSWWFNFVWVNSDPRGIDGGPLGFLSWAIPALCGTLACDAVRACGPPAATRIAVWGISVMLLGWLLSCGTTLYNVSAVLPKAEPEFLMDISDMAAENDPGRPRDQSIREPTEDPPRGMLATPDPVVPTLDRFHTWDGTLAELPFVPPPDIQKRQWNYWMMSQRAGSLSYTTFAAGLALVIYAWSLWLCDGNGWRLGIFRTLGTNSLAAYLLHDIAGWLISPYFPSGSISLLLVMTGFCCMILFVYGGCWILERCGWYLRV